MTIGFGTGSATDCIKLQQGDQDSVAVAFIDLPKSEIFNRESLKTVTAD